MRRLLKFRWDRGVPLSVYIIAIVAGPIILMLTLNMWNIYQESQSLGQKNASNIFNILAINAQREIGNELYPILAIARTAARFPPNHKDFIDNKELWDTFIRNAIQTLESMPNSLAFNYGYEDGCFLSVTALRDEYLRSSYDAPTNAKYALWTVLHDDVGTYAESRIFLDIKGKILLNRQVPHTYDPRTKEWYKAVNQGKSITITKPYIFTMSKLLGFAVAFPFENGQGVYSINIMLRGLDLFLDVLPLSDKGSLFLIDLDQYILAERTQYGTSNEQPESPSLMKLNAHPASPVRASAALVDKCSIEPEPILFRDEGEDYFFFCTLIPSDMQRFAMIMIAPISDFTSLMGAFFYNTLKFALITMIIAIPLAIFVALRLGTSLAQLMRETMKIGQYSKDGATHTLPRIREIRRLAHSIAIMKKSIRKRTESLKSIQNTLETTVLKRTEELTAALKVSEEATQAKTAFLSTVSHEIRTPINGIIGFIYLLDRSNLTEIQKSQLSKIDLSASALLNIINDVLDISKIESGKMELENVPFEIDVLLGTVYSIVEYSAFEKGIDIKVCVDPLVPKNLFGDVKRLTQVLLNLMSNAVKFTNYGSVDVNIVLETPLTEYSKHIMLSFSVTDTGIGLTSEECVRLFKPFMQADSSVSRRYGGTGLGLSIAKQLVELMGGNISVVSEYGKGSTFRFTACLEIPDTTLCVESSCISIDNQETLQQLRALANKRVLLVEDNEINQEIAKAMLEEYNLHVDIAEHGGIALDMAELQQYDAIFMDLQMPIMDGLEATRRLRTMGANAYKNDKTHALSWLVDVPIIAMTANALSEDRLQCFEAGMNAHISKPIDNTVLKKCLLNTVALVGKSL